MIQIIITLALVILLVLSLAGSDIDIVKKYIMKFAGADYLAKLGLFVPLGLAAVLMAAISDFLRKNSGSPTIGILLITVLAAAYATTITLVYEGSNPPSYVSILIVGGIPFISMSAYLFTMLISRSDFGFGPVVIWVLLLLILITWGFPEQSYGFNAFWLSFVFIMPGIFSLWRVERKSKK